MKIIDCFMFSNEHELLELRLNELDKYVDMFVICESSVTHTNNTKELTFKELWVKDKNSKYYNIYQHFKDKILYIVYNNESKLTDSWEIEHDQRNYLYNGIKFLLNSKTIDKNDVVLLSDIDELPDFTTINEQHLQSLFICNQDIYYYYLNNKNIGGYWYGTRGCTIELLESNFNFSFQKLRECCFGNIVNSGWHFTWCFGNDILRYQEKLKSFAHTEYGTDKYTTTSHITSSLNYNTDLFKRDPKNYSYEYVELKILPNYVKQNIDKFKHLINIKKEDTPSMKYSVIIPTYNHFNDCLKPCLDSVIKYSNLDETEIIVVANGCTDDTVNYVKSFNHSNIKCLEFKEALGYTKATNLGMAVSTGEYVVLLNNDAILTPQENNFWLQTLQSEFNTKPNVGITGVHYLECPVTHNPFLLFFCVMIKRQVINEIGLLDEKFNPGYGEDMDYCIRTIQAGYRLECVGGRVFDEQTKMYVGHFPINHEGEKTVHGLTNWDEIKDKNMKYLFNKYKNTSFKAPYIPIKYSIIIPTYNHLEDLLKPCIESIIKYTDLSNVEVIVVANGCKDDTEDYIKSLNNSSIKCLNYIEPLGYTVATNVGIKASVGEYVILLNNDTVLKDQIKNTWIDLLVDPFIKDDKVGITGNHYITDPITNVTFLYFYCVMISRKVINEIGLLDEVYNPGIGEDADYCLRINLAGYTTVVVGGFKWDNVNPGNYTVGTFPIYHPGGSTITSIPNWNKIKDKNSKYLIDKFKDILFSNNYEQVIEKDNKLYVTRNNKKYSIIIPTYNHLNDCLKPCINSILKYTDLTKNNIEIIVVANGCIDGTVEYLNSLNNKNIKILEYTEPIGFVKAVNAGIVNSTGEYVVLVNNDIELIEQNINNWLEALNNPFTESKYEPVGITGIYETLSDLGTMFLTFAFAMISRKLINDIGLLDEQLGIGCEDDVDYCVRATQAGYNLVSISDYRSLSEGWYMIGTFPLVHKHNQTLSQVPNIEDIMKHNRLYIKEKYNYMSQLDIKQNDDRLLRSYEKTPIKVEHNKVVNNNFLERVKSLSDFNNGPFNISPPIQPYEVLILACKQTLLLQLMEDIYCWTSKEQFDKLHFTVIGNHSLDNDYYKVIDNFCISKNIVNTFDVELIHNLTPASIAYNVGLRRILKNPNKCKYLILLNEDIRLAPQEKDTWINELIKPFNDTSVGMTGPAGCPVHYKNNHNYNFVEFICCMFDTEVFKRVGLVDENFGIFNSYHDDMDLCIRIQQNNYKVVKVSKPLNDGAIEVGTYPINHISGQNISQRSVSNIVKSAAYLCNKHNMNLTVNVISDGVDTPIMEKIINIQRNSFEDIPDNGVDELYIHDYIYPKGIARILKDNGILHNNITFDTKDPTFINLLCREGFVVMDNERLKYVKKEPELENFEVTATISTYNRYETTLAVTLLSLLNQTYLPKKILIYDDNEEPKDLREHPLYHNIFKLIQLKNIEYEVLFTKKRGQVLNHQDALTKSNTELIWRLDDDIFIESNVLETLVNNFRENPRDLAASSCSILMTDRPFFNIQKELQAISIKDINLINTQWVINECKEKIEVEHIHCSFLVRKSLALKVGGYFTNLSPIGHREETIFTYKLHHYGYKLLIDTHAVIWHLKEEKGGIRAVSNQKQEYGIKDEQIFANFLNKLDVQLNNHFFIVLNNGLGDHWACKTVLNEIREAHKDKKIIIFCCYPEVFEDEQDVIISNIHNAISLLGNVDSFSIYKLGSEQPAQILDLYRKMYIPNFNK